MPNIFHPAMNTISRVSIFGAVFFLGGLIGLAWILVRTPYVTEAGVIREQPVPFSHQHHVTDCGIDCRYCHTAVEVSPFASVPSTSICMNCHAYLFRDQDMLAAVRESRRTGEPLQWTRVHDLPDFAYFNHSIHVHKGIGCVTCHGQVDQMPLMWREESLLMEWCLQCHRNPERHLRPREFAFRMQSLDALAETDEFRTYVADKYPDLAGPSIDLQKLRHRLAEEYHVQRKLNCSNCHW
jgi:hypothetical protein